MKILYLEAFIVCEKIINEKKNGTSSLRYFRFAISLSYYLSHSLTS